MRIRLRFPLLSIVVLMGVLLTSLHPLPSGAINPQVPTLSMTVEAGFGGYIKRKSWFPLRMNISTTEATEGELVIDEGELYPDRIYASITLPRNARRSITLYGRARTPNPTVRFLYKGNELASVGVNVRTLADEDRLIVVASDPIDSYNFLGDLRTPLGGRTYVAQSLISQFPDHVAALSSVDQIIVSNMDTAQFTEAQRAALHAWVIGGGQLVLGGGPGARLTANGVPDLVSARTVPINTVNSAVLDNLYLYASASSTSTLSSIPTIPTSTLNLPLTGLQVTHPDAQVLIGSDETPLVVRRRIGRGLIDQLAFDITLTPLRDWPDRARAMNAIFGGRVGIPINNGMLRNEDAASIASRTLPTVRLPPFLPVAGFIVVYVLCIGPLNFLVLRRLKLFSLGWITIPVITLLFTLIGLIVGMGFRGSGGQMHRLSVAFGDSRMTTGSAQSVLGLFASRRMVFDVNVGRALVDGVRDNIAVTTSNIPVIPFSMSESDDTVLHEVLVSNSSTRSFYMRGEVQLPKITTDLKLSLGKNFTDVSRIEGSIVNASDATLFDCSVIAGGDFQSLHKAPFGPGDKLNIALSMTHRQNRPVIFPPTERMPSNTFSDSNFSYAPSTQRVGRMYAQGNNLMDELVRPRNLSDPRSGARRTRELLGAALGDVRAQINHGVSLACWENADHSGAKTNPVTYTDYGLRIWELHVAPALAQPGAVIPADVLLWNVSYSSSSVTPGLEELRIDAGKHIFQYQPWVPLRVGSPDARVNVRMEFSSNTSRRMLRDTSIWVFDWQRREFVRAYQLQGNTNEDFSMQGNLLSPTGELRLMFDAPPQSVIELLALRVEAQVR